jgi:ornithine carbamoyltransferase
MQQKANSGYLDATSKLESLVLKGVPFRDAHHQVGEWVMQAIDKNCTLSAIEITKSLTKTPHLCTGMELDSMAINTILDLAKKIKQSPEKYYHKLANKKLVMLFEKPSFRTRLSFSLAIQTMGGMAIESISHSRKKEHPADMMRVLNGYCDFVMLRTHDDSVFSEMADHASIPIINGLSELYHPCQILADLMSLQDRFGALENLTLSYIGDGNNILHSLIMMAPLVGINVHYCCPLKRQPNQEIILASNEKMINAFSTPEQAVSGADAVYTDVWTSMGCEDDEDDENHFQGYQVNETLIALAKPEAVFMHCMPMERGKEVSFTLPDSHASIIFSQSENRLHAQKAVLIYLNELK